MDCKIVHEMKPNPVTNMITKTFKKVMCDEEEKWIKHEKMIPKCRNVTKINCVTLWKEQNGQQVSP